MKKYLIGLVLWSFALTASRAAPVDNCWSCHESDKVGKKYRQDIHFQYGVSCADCHGGDRAAEDPDESMSRAKGFVGVPAYPVVAELCARCHSDEKYMKKVRPELPVGQFEQYRKSVHGENTKEGSKAIATCVTCHSVHDIVSVKNPRSPVYPTNIPGTCGQCHSNANYMKQHNPGLPIDQVEKYRTSTHGEKNKKGDIKVAQCASCHSSHDIRSVKEATSSVYATNLPATCGKCHSNKDYMAVYGIPTDQVEKFKSSVHGNALLKKNDLAAPACNDCHGNHGAVPPGFQNVSNVCGSCHATNAELFSSSVHKEAFDKKKIPECVACHQHHDIVSPTHDFLGVGPKSACTPCHKDGDKGFIAAWTMKNILDSLSLMRQGSEEVLGQAEKLGMNVEDSRFELEELKHIQIQSRTVIHAIDVSKLRQLTQPGFAIVGNAGEKGAAAIDEYYFRRTGLGISTLLLSVLAAALYLKIRRIEKKPEDGIHS